MWAKFYKKKLRIGVFMYYLEHKNCQEVFDLKGQEQKKKKKKNLTQE